MIHEIDLSKIPDHYLKVAVVCFDPLNKEGDEYRYVVAYDSRLLACSKSERAPLIGTLERFCAQLREPPTTKIA